MSFELSVDKFVLSAYCGTVAGVFTMDTDGAALYFFDIAVVGFAGTCGVSR